MRQSSYTTNEGKSISDMFFMNLNKEEVSITTFYSLNSVCSLKDVPKIIKAGEGVSGSHMYMRV